MTKQLKILLTLLIIGGAFLYSCDKDFEEDISSTNNHNTSNSNLKVSKIYFKDFKDNINLLTEIEKSIGKPKTSLNQRIIQSSDNSFYIDTDFAYYIEDENGNHSYTFQIIRDNSTFRLENLILNSNNQDSYDAFISQYNITEQEYLELEHGHNPDLSSKVTLTPVNGTIIDINSIFARESAEGMCLTTTVIPESSCSCAGHTISDLQNGEICTCSDSETLYPEQVIYSWSACGEEEGVGGGYDNGDNPYNGGANEGTGGSTSDNDNSENTDPNQSNDIEDTENPVNTKPVTTRGNTPCEEISKIIEKPQFSINMLELKNNVNGTKEKGFIIRDMEGDDAFSDVVIGDDNGNVAYPYADSTPEDLEKLFKTIATAHNHLVNDTTHIGVPTPEDLVNLWLNGALETHPQNPNRRIIPIKSTIFVITNIGFFSLRIKDMQKLEAFKNDYVSWTIEETDDYMKEIFRNKKEYNINYDSTHDEQVTGFLRFIQDQDIGLDLYEGDVNNFANWRKLNLVDNGNGNFNFYEEPCNN